MPHRSAALGRVERLRWRARAVGIAVAREIRPVSLHASAHRAIGVGPRRLRLGVERGENVKDVGRVIGAGESSPAEEVGKTLNIKTFLPFSIYLPAHTPAVSTAITANQGFIQLDVLGQS